MRATLDTGVDALTHAVEAYVSRKANPFSEGLALNAVPDHRTPPPPRLRRRGRGSEAREAMMLAAAQAGIAFSKAGVAFRHGMSRPIGAHFHVAHGLSNAMLFPAVTAFSVPAAESRYADCARALGVAGDGDCDVLPAGKFVEALRDLCEDLEVPTPRVNGIAKDEWFRLSPLVAEQALASGSPADNPVGPPVDEIQDLCAQIYG
ncbi:iron-containing alcohol dehydrogenase [Streptomyces sp. NBC_01275]|uniref:iron-containing alcohol dehydrogenase n=1 Tax=Streptomyces sp. NBC_01275 TaxID=2903807 RepID=UPI0022584759|nr:iron-containing alcohol dehydrogenase [Streptomyces sp. NBC_01275]MCX4767345.1 iron-containing alcohol dehydrogenase [Streptomyces sp. NBC_01275]